MYRYTFIILPILLALRRRTISLKRVRSIMIYADGILY